MRRLSNFFRSRDPASAVASTGVCRPVQRHEIEPALHLVLASESGLAGDDAVHDFLSFANQRQIDLNQMWIALLDDRIAWAVLPIVNPGRTMLLLAPSRIPQATPVPLIRQLTEQVCGHWSRRDVHLAQFLLDPDDRAMRELYAGCGFDMLAELLYLQRTVRRAPAVRLPEGFALHPYAPEIHAEFGEAITGSYENSLDCPALNGRRNIDDVLDGHKATGQFEPDLWHLLTESGEPRGVLILSPTVNGDSVELVYLGLVPQARGRGLGDALMHLAMRCVQETGRSELALAVDGQNQPALKLYYRHGLQRIGSRLALLRDLRLPPAPPAPR